MNARNDVGFSLHWVEVAVLVLVVAAIFQVFLRYQYVTSNGTTWRIDRVTRHVCAMHRNRAECIAPSPGPRERGPVGDGLG
ncbi:MAG TPA: hypothetical protein VHR97_08645 [Candidatus Baltobacteraceae bacterium]|nr:hypothetical protein [Candidatus Baltobacteraceae bacterium]